MKKLFALVIVLYATSKCPAQNIGIGTTSPNAKAILDISSTTRGILIPRMTTSQRFAISTPPNGLIVYDTDKNELYHYNGTSWLVILNGGYWTRPITSRSRIANANDSVGIGTNSPTEWLDVDGNIRSRNNVIADNNITAENNVSGGSLVSTGTLTVVGTSLLSGNITTNGDVSINGTNATIQLKTSGVNKGFFQLSGDNVRTGTNSGNTDGRFIIRNNGADRIAVEADGKLTTPATGDNNSMIPLCYGVVNDAGVLLRGTDNVTIEKIGPGNSTTESYYRIHCSGISATSIITITPDIAYLDQTAARCYLNGTARAYTYSRSYNPDLGITQIYYYHGGFSFVIYK